LLFYTPHLPARIVVLHRAGLEKLGRFLENKKSWAGLFLKEKGKGWAALFVGREIFCLF